MRVLTEAEYLATMDEPQAADLTADAPFDFWVYVDAMPQAVEGYVFDRVEVSASFTMRSGLWQHVLLATDMPNVFVVLVLDLDARVVAGHRLLDLNRLYGVEVEG